MSFPAEAVPDGALFAPHHFLYGCYLALVVCWVVGDDYRHVEPLGVLLGLGLALFGWAHLWRFYPVAGALFVLGGLAVATLAVPFGIEISGYTVGGFYARYGWWATVVLGLWLAFAWDDAISHVFGVWTPVDAAWRAWLVPVMA